MQMYDILEELMKLQYITKSGYRKVPIPKFFYIQRYGRRVEDEIDKILPYIGNKSWFLFKTDGRFRTENLLQSFVLELDKYASVGKAYNECVLIEFTEDVCWKSGFVEFLEYLRSQQDSFNFIFTMRESKNTATIQKCLEQYFFVQRVDAKKYEVKEQMELIRQLCMEYKMSLDIKASEMLQKSLENKEWNTKDYVLQKLTNATNKMIYDLLRENPDGVNVLSKEDANQILKNVESAREKIHTIGFRQGGYTYE